jgi:hypothetical protein
MYTLSHYRVVYGIELDVPEPTHRLRTARAGVRLIRWW